MRFIHFVPATGDLGGTVRGAELRPSWEGDDVSFGLNTRCQPTNKNLNKKNLVVTVRLSARCWLTNLVNSVFLSSSHLLVVVSYSDRTSAYIICQIMLVRACVRVSV